MAGKKINRELSIFINDREVVNSMGGITKEITRVNNEMKNLNKNSASYDSDLKKLQGTLGDLRGKQSAFKDEISGTVSTMGKLKNAIGPVASGLLAAFSIGAVISGFTAALGNAVKSINDFEQGVADLSSITGATGKDLDYLKKQAIELGESTIGGAQAVVEAYGLIASAKPELLENGAALNTVTEAVITLAKAAGMELPAAATALTDAMNQFGVGADQAAVFVDALANGAKYGSAEIPQITEALLKFGAVAKSANINILESTALIELLAENGLKGAEAGTSLRNVLLKLSAPDVLPDKALEEFKKFGISLEFLKDKTIPIQEKMEALKPLLKDTSSVVKVFGLENASAAINIISHTDRLQELIGSMGEVGTASEQAAVKMDTVKNKTELLKSKYDSLILSIGTGTGVVSGFFKYIIDQASGAISQIQRLNSSWDELFGKAKGAGVGSGAKSFSRQFSNLQGTGSDEDIAKSIKTVAEKQFKMYEAQYKANEQKLANLKGQGLLKGILGGYDLEKELLENKEKLTKSFNEQAEIIRQAQAKIKGKVNEVSGGGANVPGVSGETPADKKKGDQAAKKAEADRKKAEQDAKAELLSLAKSRTDVAKAELDAFLADNKTKIDKTKSLTEVIIEEESKRLEVIKQKQLEALDIERNNKITRAEEEGKSAEEIKNLKYAYDLEYETAKQNLEFTFVQSTDTLKKTYADEQKALALEQLLIENELALAEADSKSQEDAIKQAQDYKKQIDGYKKLLADKKISKEEYDRFKDAADAKQAEIDKARELTQLQNTLGGFNQLAGALGEMFGQSKGLAIVQAGINGAMAVTSILAQYPKYDGGFAMIAAIAAAGITTVAQIGKITSAKPPKGPKFYDGGYTGAQANLGYDEYGAVTGYVHKNEWVAPESMTQSPRYAATISWLEAERKNNLRGFYDGGPTSSTSVNTSAPAMDATMQSNELLQAVLFHLQNPKSPTLLFGYKEAQSVNDLNIETQQSKNNGIVS